MKRTQTPVVGTLALERDKIAHHLDYIGGVKNTLDCCTIDFLHIMAGNQLLFLNNLAQN